MKKNQIKGLKQLATRLPYSVELQTYSIIKKGWEFTEDELGKSNISIEAEKEYVQKGHCRVIEINHFNRLKKAYARSKEQGLVNYIEWVENNNKRMNVIFEKLKLESVSEEIMSIAKKGTKGFWSNLLNFLFAFVHIFKKKVA